MRNKNTSGQCADRDTSLRMAFLSYAYGRGGLGLGRYGESLVNELRKLGTSVDVFTSIFHVKSFGPPLFFMKNAFLKLKKYDLVHSNEGAGVFLRHPYMIETYHHDYKQTGDARYNLVFHRLETLQCHKAQHIIVPSFLTKNTLLHYGFPEDKISVIHHGVDHNMFVRNESSRVFLRRKYDVSSCFVVINVGQLRKYKRQIDIVKALQGIPNVAFILVGNGEEEKNIKKSARNKGVRLIHFKYVPERLLVDLYNVADVYVHTSILEGFGLTVLEAMACGLPIIAYKVADFDRIVKGAGYLMDIGDVNGIRSTLLILRRDHDIRDKMSSVAVSHSKDFTWSKSARCEV